MATLGEDLGTRIDMLEQKKSRAKQEFLAAQDKPSELAAMAMVRNCNIVLAYLEAWREEVTSR